MGLSSLDDPNCATDRHKAPIWAELYVKKEKKTITTKCDQCNSIIQISYKPTIIIKHLEFGN